MKWVKKINPKSIWFLLVVGIAYGLCLSNNANRAYIVSITGSYLFAFIIYRVRKEDFKSLFDKKIWCHKTTLNEAYIILVILAFLYFVINDGDLFKPYIFALFFYNFFEALSLPIISEKPSIILTALLFISIVLASEAAYYCAHRILHSSRFMWEFHKVHHSAQIMTPFTTLRQHPIEFMFNYFMSALFAGFIIGMFYYFSPNIEISIILVKSHIVFNIFLFLGGSLAHSHAWISYGYLDAHIVSPAMHQIHHSQNSKHFDKNFGFMLTFFDRLFGTLYIPKEREYIKFGLGKEDVEYTNFYGSIISPIFKAIKHIIPKN